MNDDALLREAIRLAATHSASGLNGPFGAVVAQDGVVVGEGWNRVVQSHDPTAHAEVVAIRDASRRLGTHVLSDCVLFTSCEPCPLCLAAAYWAHIPRVVFAASKEDAASVGFDDEEIYREVALGWDERRISGEMRLRAEGRAVLDAWLANSRKILY